MWNSSERMCAILSLFLVAMIVLSACGNSLQQPRHDDKLLLTPTSTITLTSTRALVTPTATVTRTLAPVTSTATNVPVSATAASTPVSFAPDDIRMAYNLDGYLYFQAGSEPRLQLTYSRDYVRPIGFSENGEKIFFIKGAYNDLYSIQIDGSNEQPLATQELLTTTNAEYDDATTFCEPLIVPHSPLILFRTCSHPDGYTTIYQDDVFVVDTETNEARVALPRGSGGPYFPSPDGTMLAIPHVGYLDLLRIDGTMIKHKLATYPISEPWPLYSLVHWTEDSKDLILALPINTFYDSSPPPTFEVWRYSAETGIGTQIEMEHLPSGLAPVWPSPDGNWILHRNEEEPPFYIVNANDGTSQPYEPNIWGTPCAWSPDNIHFAYDGLNGLYIGSVNGPPDFIERGDCVGWLDANRFVFYSLANRAYSIKEIGGESKIILTGGNIWHLRSYGSIVFFPPVRR